MIARLRRRRGEEEEEEEEEEVREGAVKSKRLPADAPRWTGWEGKGEEESNFEFLKHTYIPFN